MMIGPQIQYDMSILMTLVIVLIVLFVIDKNNRL